MKANDPLNKLLKAAAAAERAAVPAPEEMPFGLATRVLAARNGPDTFSFLPLFRGALACAAVIAIVCASLHHQRQETPDLYDYTLNYSVAAAYIE